MHFQYIICQSEQITLAPPPTPSPTALYENRQLYYCIAIALLDIRIAK